MKKILKKYKILKFGILLLRTFKVKPGFSSRVKNLALFFRDYKNFKKLKKNSSYLFRFEDLYPRIYDRTEMTDLDPVYYIQGAWCARKVFDHKPLRHYDIGSQALMVGIISQFTPTTMVDIRPLSVSLPELSFVKGDIIHLPFENNSILSLSSICVIEHIGLGRYGDPLDAYGTEKSASELSRVLAPNGNLYISVPIDSENKIYFNAHRAFTRDYILSLFPTLTLIEESYIYGREVLKTYDAQKGFGTGLYHFRK